MKLPVLIFFFSLAGFISLGQTPLEKILFCEMEVSEQLDVLKEGYSANKVIPEAYELQCLLALSYYPELKSENIKFVYGKGAYSMAARPALLSLFRSRKNREYRIFINTESKNKGLLLHQVPFNAQVGIIGHELAHILDYTNKHALRIALDGIGYMSKRFRSKLEHATDKEAIKRGLGWQVLEFCTNIHESEEVPSAYKIYKTKVYMTPDSIREYIGACCTQ